MTQRLLVAGLMLIAFGVTARGDDKLEPKRPAAAQPPAAKAGATHPGLEKLKKLAGTWVEADKDGKPTDKVVSVIKVTASGSAVHETLFPNTQMEMMSVYHLDKNDLVMTHYCMLGNQPRMKADPKSPANQIKWLFDGGTNLDPKKDMHMHSAVVTFVDADRIEIAGEAWADGKPCPDHCATMKLVRKK
jgi:hypothetical protein